MTTSLYVPDNNNLLLDSREVASMTNIRHDNLLAKIDGYVSVLNADLNFKVSDFFIEGDYIDSTGRSLKKYDCTKKGCSMIANKMTGTKGILFTAAYVTKFELMENELSMGNKPVPSYMIDDPIRRAEKWIIEEKEKLALEGKVKELEHKSKYVDTILQSKGTVTTSQIAKDYGLTANELNTILKDEKIQYKQNKQWLLYKEYATKGYTQSYSFDFRHTDGTPDVKMNTRWTQRGRLFIHDVLTKRGVKPNIEKEFNDAR